jgi:hypothetical protein
MLWPPYLPDLNPIENVWWLLKKHIHKNNPNLLSLKGQAALEGIVRAAVVSWEELKDEMLDHLCMSMPKRVQAVLDAEGWYTKY